MIRPNSALEAANLRLLKIKSIRYAGKADVYNMEVTPNHNFIAESSFIVHNCIDGLRYSLSPLFLKRKSTMADIARSIIAKKSLPNV